MKCVRFIFVCKDGDGYVVNVRWGYIGCRPSGSTRRTPLPLSLGKANLIVAKIIRKKETIDYVVRTDTMALNFEVKE